MEYLRSIRFNTLEEVSKELTNKLSYINELKEVKLTPEGQILLVAKRKEGFSPQFNKLIKLEEGKSIEEVETIDEESKASAYLVTTDEASFFLEKALYFHGDFTIGENVIYMEREGSDCFIEEQLREIVEMAIFMDDKQEYLAILADKLGMKAIAEEARGMI